jgi:hypothetical protein
MPTHQPEEATPGPASYEHMSDEDANKLMLLLGKYADAAKDGGDSFEDTGDLTVREVLGDLVATLPAYLTVDLPESVRVITDADAG